MVVSVSLFLPVASDKEFAQLSCLFGAGLGSWLGYLGILVLITRCCAPRLWIPKSRQPRNSATASILGRSWILFTRATHILVTTYRVSEHTKSDLFGSALNIIFACCQVSRCFSSRACSVCWMCRTITRFTCRMQLRQFKNLGAVCETYN